MNCQSSYFRSLCSHAFKSPAKNFLEPSESLCESRDDLQILDAAVVPHSAPGRRSWGRSPLFMAIAWIHIKRLMKPKLICHDVWIQFHCFLPRVWHVVFPHVLCDSPSPVSLTGPWLSSCTFIPRVFPLCVVSSSVSARCLFLVNPLRSRVLFIRFVLCFCISSVLGFSACFLLSHHLPDWRSHLGPCFATTKAPQNDIKLIWVVVVCSWAHLLPCSWRDFMTYSVQ